MISNKCYYYMGSTAYIQSNSDHTKITLEGCTFSNNSAVRGAAVCIANQSSNNPGDYSFVATIERCVFDHNIADESVIYIHLPTDRLIKNQTTVIFNTSNFTDNIGVCIFLSQCKLMMKGNILFENNTADNGGAMYIDETSTVEIGDGANVSFIDNSAVLHGGAIFVELNYGCNQNHTTFVLQTNNTLVSFINSQQSYDDNSQQSYILVCQNIATLT